MKTLIVIPAFNEEKDIGNVARKTRECCPHMDILVVNDGSCDQTARIADEAGASVITHPFNIGYGAALQTGYKYAVKNGYNFVIQMDADGQHDPVHLERFHKEIKDKSADVIIGSRFLSSTDYKPSFTRGIGMFLFSKLVSVIVRQKITDSTSGFQGLNQDVIKFLVSDIYPGDYPDADVIIMLHRSGFRIKEIPLAMHRKGDSKSMHNGFKPVYYVLKMVLSIFVTLLRYNPKTNNGGKPYASQD